MHVRLDSSGKVNNPSARESKKRMTISWYRSGRAYATIRTLYIDVCEVVTDR